MNMTSPLTALSVKKRPLYESMIQPPTFSFEFYKVLSVDFAPAKCVTLEPILLAA